MSATATIEKLNHIFTTKYPEPIMLAVALLFCMYTSYKLNNLDLHVDQIEKVDITEIRRDIATINVRLAKVEVRLDHIEEDIREMKEDIKEMKADITELKADVKTLLARKN